MMESVDIDHDLFLVDEFDALVIEPRTPDQPEDELPKKYPAKWHARKVVEELGAKDGLIFLPGQDEAMWEDSDMGPPFRQRRYFYYMSGADFPGCSLTYDIGADKLTLWIPYTPPATELYFGKTPSPDDVLAVTDVHDVKYARELPAYLTSRLPRVRTLYALRASQLPPGDILDDRYAAAAATSSGSSKTRNGPPIATSSSSLTVDVTSLQPAMDRARVIKTSYEIAAIRQANAISSAAHAAVKRRMGSFTRECEVEAAFRGVCTSRFNAHRQAYAIIAGSGPNASTLHYDANNESLQGRQLLVLDAGAEWRCYASDVTRTLPVGGQFKHAGARAVYDIVARMQDECIKGCRPGVVYRDLQLLATKIAVRGLLQLGILKDDDGGDDDEDDDDNTRGVGDDERVVEKIFRQGTGAAFFPHGLGHHVGLDVHDVLSRELLRPAGQNTWGKRRPVGPQTLRAMIQEQEQEQQQQQAQDRSTSGGGGGGDGTEDPTFRTLRPGMVVTIEPGIYFCRPYIEAYFLAHAEHARFIDRKVLDRFWAVGGCRIEDCVLVTDDGRGCENLTGAPRF